LKEDQWGLVLVVVVVLVVAVDLGEGDVEAVVEVGLARQVSLAQLLVTIYILSDPSEILVHADIAVVSVASVREVPLLYQSAVLNLPVPCLSS